MALLFIKKQHNEQDVPPAPAAPAGHASPAVAAEKVDVHTMPEKFMSVDKGESSGWLKKRIVIGILVILILGGVMGFAAWLFIRSINPPTASVPLQPVQSGESPSTNNPPTATVTLPLPPPTSTPVTVPSLIPPASSTEGQIDPVNGADTGTPTTTPTSTPPLTPPAEENGTGDPVPPPRLGALPSSRDSDGDGLTDTEEGLWGTNPLRPDSDGDGYTDGSELAALYDPVRGGGARLESSPGVRTYLNPQLQYTILVPVSWENRLLDQTQATQIIFTSATGEFIGISAQENFEGFTDPRDWYRYDYPSVSTSLLQEVKTETLNGVFSPDGLASYFIDRGYLYALSYNPGIRETVNFQSTYRMMVQSFRTFVKPDAGLSSGQGESQ